MKPFRKDILREAVELCKQSNLYYVFTREEKREAVLHVYNIINECQCLSGEVLRNPWEFESLSLQT
jgi:hypothetical protein